MFTTYYEITNTEFQFLLWNFPIVEQEKLFGALGRAPDGIARVFRSGKPSVRRKTNRTKLPFSFFVAFGCFVVPSSGGQIE